MSYISNIFVPDICAPIYVTVDTDFASDENGFWESNRGWRFSTSITSAHFNGFQTTLPNWPRVAKAYFDEIVTMNKAFATRPIAHNLISMARVSLFVNKPKRPNN